MCKIILVIASCVLALSLATPIEDQPKSQLDAKKTDKRSIGAYHYHTEAEVGFQNVPVVQNVKVPVTKHVSVPVTSSVNVPVVKNVAVPVVSYKPKLYYEAPAFYSYGYPSYGYSGYTDFGLHGSFGQYGYYL